MASNPQGAPMLPLFYQSLSPLSSQAHAGTTIRMRSNYPEAAKTHAVPLTVDEFSLAMKHYPIVFGSGDSAAPLALFGLSDGINNFVDAEGNWQKDVYIPAYIRRYPFLLAKFNENSEELTLCFDDKSAVIDLTGKEGVPLFDGEQASEHTKSVLSFCEQFETAVARTRAFMDELQKLDIIIDGEVQLQQDGMEQPAVYRGFRMVSEEKLRELRGDQLRKIVQNGMIGLIYAHLFSLGNVRELFAKQMLAAAA
jgi:hypothetical protein